MIIVAPYSLNEYSVSDKIKEIEQHSEDKEIVIDLSQLRMAYPIGSLVLAQYLKHKIENDGCSLSFTNAELFKSSIGYLSTVGFFKFLGQNPPSIGEINFAKTYLKVSRISYGELTSLQRDHELTFGVRPPIQEIIQEYSDNYSLWMFGRIEPVITFCFREIIRNVFEHAKTTNCSIFGQIYRNRDRIEMCIADSGIGIRNSLSSKYGENIDDNWAVLNAIYPGITSGSVTGQGQYDNSGFGLYVLSEIAKRFGYIVVASGTTLIRVSHIGVEKHECFYPGTYVGLDFHYRDLLNNREIIQSIVDEGEALAKEMGIKGRASISTRKI